MRIAPYPWLRIPTGDRSVIDEALSAKQLTGMIVFVLLAFSVPLRNAFYTSGFDWNYFNSLNLVVRSSVLSYKIFPMLDPWQCGGINLWANPQNRIFSPMFFFDLALPPKIANILGLMITGFLGQLGFYRLLRLCDTSKPVAHFGGVIFILSHWFGLHFMEGHIPFGHIQLLPMVLYQFLLAPRKRNLFTLVLIGAWMILDGAFYAFYFSVITMVVFFTSVINIRIYLKTIFQYRREVLLSGLCFLLLTSPKTFSLFVVGQGFPYRESFAQVPFEIFSTVFFDFHQSNLMQMQTLPWRFHEYGCYVGFLFIAILTMAVFWIIKGKTKPWIGILAWMMILFWGALGWGYPYNPWKIHQTLPFFQKLHVQSRWLIIVVFLAIFILSKYLERIFLSQKRMFYFLALFLVFEWYAVRLYNWEYLYDQGKASILAEQQLIDETTLKRTVAFADKPEHYFSANGSSSCYEPQINYEVPVKSYNDPDYHGEIYFLSGLGDSAIEYFSPEGISLSFSAQHYPDVLELNMTHIPGWQIASGEGQLISQRYQRLQIKVGAEKGKIWLTYRPPGYPWLFLSQMMGILLSIFSFVRFRGQNI